MLQEHNRRVQDLLDELDEFNRLAERGAWNAALQRIDAISQKLEDFQVVKDPPMLQASLPRSSMNIDAPRIDLDDPSMLPPESESTGDEQKPLSESLDSASTLASKSADGITAAPKSVTGSPLAEDLEENTDVQITPEILELAVSLENSPYKIYQYVRNNFDFEPYLGSRKGSQETLNQMSGNDYDLASLLIALLRASEIPARYVRGTVELTVEQARNWLGVNDGQTAGSILTTAGMEGVNYFLNGELASIRCSRVWVEAYIPYANYRGQDKDGTGKMWVPMDPATKEYEYQDGIDIPLEMGFDAETFMANYISTYHELSPVELYMQQISDYLAINYPGYVYGDILRTREILPESIGFIPGSLPFKVISIDSDFARIPDDKRYKMRFHLYNGTTTFIDYTVNLPDIAGKRVTISYIPAETADEAVINSYGGLYQTPPYLVELKPVLKIDGEDAAVSTAGVMMGITHNSDMHFTPPAGQNNVTPVVNNTIIAGTYQAVGIDTGKINPDIFMPLTRKTTPLTDDVVGEKLWKTAMGYLDRIERHDGEVSRTMQVVITKDVSEAIVENTILVTYSGSIPQTFEWRGLVVDADRCTVGTFPVDGDEDEEKAFMVLSGADGSVSENRIFEDTFDEEAVSTIKILELASDLGIPVYTFNSSNIGSIYSSLNLSSSVESAIYSAVAGGNEVTVPRDNITYMDWYGTGYINMDPDTGAAGYIISGGHSGGATVDSWTAWKMELFTIFRDISSITADINYPSADGKYFPPVNPRIYSCDQRLYFDVDYTINYSDGSKRTVNEVFVPHKAYSVGTYVFNAGYGTGETRSFIITDITATGVPSVICKDQEKSFGITISPGISSIGSPTFKTDEGRLSVTGTAAPYTMKGVSAHAQPDYLSVSYECGWRHKHEVLVLPEHVVGIPGLGMMTTRYGEHDFLIAKCPDHSTINKTIPFEIDGCSNSPDSLESNVIETKYATNFNLYVTEPIWGSDVGNISYGNAGGQTLPCNKHDICYQTCGNSQAGCDANLENDMQNVCRASYPTTIPATVPKDRMEEYVEERETCLEAASFYRWVLSGAGGFAWTLRQNQHCYCCKGN